MSLTDKAVNDFIDKLTVQESLELLGLDNTDRVTLFNQLKTLSDSEFLHYRRHYLDINLK